MLPPPAQQGSNRIKPPETRAEGQPPGLAHRTWPWAAPTGLLVNVLTTSLFGYATTFSRTERRNS
eukprot:14171923-Heterocapsa_arctica.AAC.1